MRAPAKREARQRILERLAELLGVDAADAALRTAEPGASRADAVIEIAGHTFLVAWRGSGSTAAVSAAMEEARQRAASPGSRAIPLVAVPFMGPVGRQRCIDAGMAWLDLSGNAWISAPGLRVLVDGQPNQFKRPGRPSSPFAPKSARIARWLLLHPNEAATQREIAGATGMDEGFTSRIVARLVDDGLVVREERGAIRVRDPDLLLDAWREDYDFSRHRIIRGHVPARSGDLRLRRLANGLEEHEDQYAATGLAAAWMLSRFAGFILTSIYVPEIPSSRALATMGFREEARGANTWLVVPSDEGVLHGAAEHEGVRCVHPVQVYLDLQAQPERAQEAADQLRAQFLRWSSDA